MNNFSAHAVRQGNTVEVTVRGFLPNSCSKIVVDDFYPGGNIVYVHDPGYTQLFLKVVSSSDSKICIQNVVPFTISKEIHDDFHQEVEVTIKGNSNIIVPISKIEDEFIVVNMIIGIIPPPSYSIVPALFEVNPSIYEKSFGPDTYEACKKFIIENTTEKNPHVLELSGGGGGSASPRG